MRLTHATALVLLALSRGSRHGFDIIDATGLTSGTVYPILRRLEAAGLTRSTWESVGPARDEGRPPRRNYTLTPEGRTLVDEARVRHPKLGRLLGDDGSAASPA